MSFSLVSAETNLVGNYRTLRGLRTINPEGLPSTKYHPDLEQFAWRYNHQEHYQHLQECSRKPSLSAASTHLKFSYKFSRFNHNFNQNTKSLTLLPTSFLKETCLLLHSIPTIPPTLPLPSSSESDSDIEEKRNWLY